MTKPSHWATGLIGLPYLEGGAGPEAFDCWGLVRYVFETVHGIKMPVIEVGTHLEATPENARMIRHAAEVSGWRPTDERLPQVDDIVIMTGLEGRHVGVMVAANGGLLILHCLEGAGVCAQPLSDLSLFGFRDIEFWRREKAA